MKRDICGPDDVVLFVNEFYVLALQDPLLGPVFAHAITDWTPHLDRLYKFWNSALFEELTVTEQSISSHSTLNVDRAHYDRWLLHFNRTIDTYFEGEVANRAKKKAAQTAGLFLSRLKASGS
ncbi:group III truncated hemoglobin [Arcticibacter tournemirensis]